MTLIAPSIFLEKQRILERFTMLRLFPMTHFHRELLIFSPPLYSMNPNLLNLFMK
jgi:hypothetical protein